VIFLGCPRAGIEEKEHGGSARRAVRQPQGAHCEDWVPSVYIIAKPRLRHLVERTACSRGFLLFRRRTCASSACCFAGMIFLVGIVGSSPLSFS
jgi:hypothetical protein